MGTGGAVGRSNWPWLSGSPVIDAATRARLNELIHPLSEGMEEKLPMIRMTLAEDDVL